MKLVTFSPSSGEIHAGALVGRDKIVPIARAARVLDGPELVDDVVSVVGNEEARSWLSTLVAEAEIDAATLPSDLVTPLDEVSLLAPLPVPNSIRDIPSFLDHMRAGFAAIGVSHQTDAIGTIPAYYKGNRRTVVGPGADVVCPPYADELDFELEFGVVIVREGKDVTPEQAEALIGGYCMFNDVSARARQAEEMQLGMGPAKGKDFDTGNVLGPWLVVDEITDERELTYAVHVNGETWTEGDTSSMTWTLPELVAYCSTGETLYPGDFIAAGTVPRGCGLELGRVPKLGDVVELEVSGLGVLRNRFVSARSGG